MPFKKLFAASMNKYSGKTDFLEAVCAACALMANASGGVSDEEVDATVKAIAANPLLMAAFNQREVEKVATTMLTRVQGGRVGRMGLMREIEEAAGDADQAEAIMLAALDVAESDGEIDEEEMAMAKQISTKLSVNLDALLA